MADVNWDGVNELVLGTFGRVSYHANSYTPGAHSQTPFSLQQVLVYQFSEAEGMYIYSIGCGVLLDQPRPPLAFSRRWTGALTY